MITKLIANCSKCWNFITIYIPRIKRDPGLTIKLLLQCIISIWYIECYVVYIYTMLYSIPVLYQYRLNWYRSAWILWSARVRIKSGCDPDQVRISFIYLIQIRFGIFYKVFSVRTLRINSDPELTMLSVLTYKNNVRYRIMFNNVLQ